jgi:hypothetical protein
MRTQATLVHAHAAPRNDGVTLTIKLGNQAAITLMLKPNEAEYLVTVIGQALGLDDDDGELEPSIADADG